MLGWSICCTHSTSLERIHVAVYALSRPQIEKLHCCHTTIHHFFWTSTLALETDSIKIQGYSCLIPPIQTSLTQSAFPFTSTASRHSIAFGFITAQFYIHSRASKHRTFDSDSNQMRNACLELTWGRNGWSFWSCSIHRPPPFLHQPHHNALPSSSKSLSAISSRFQHPIAPPRLHCLHDHYLHEMVLIAVPPKPIAASWNAIKKSFLEYTSPVTLTNSSTNTQNMSSNRSRARACCKILPTDAHFSASNTSAPNIDTPTIPFSLATPIPS